MRGAVVLLLPYLILGGDGQVGVEVFKAYGIRTGVTLDILVPV